MILIGWWINYQLTSSFAVNLCCWLSPRLTSASWLSKTPPPRWSSFCLREGSWGFDGHGSDVTAWSVPRCHPSGISSTPTVQNTGSGWRFTFPSRLSLTPFNPAAFGYGCGSPSFTPSTSSYLIQWLIAPSCGANGARRRIILLITTFTMCGMTSHTTPSISNPTPSLSHNTSPN